MSRRFRDRQSSLVAVVILATLVALSCWAVSAMPVVREVTLTETTPEGEIVMELSSFMRLEAVVHPTAGNRLTLTVELEPLGGPRVFQLSLLHHTTPTATSPMTEDDRWSWELSTAPDEFSNTNFASVANEDTDPDFLTKGPYDFLSGTLAAYVDVQPVATPEPAPWLLIILSIVGFATRGARHSFT